MKGLALWVEKLIDYDLAYLKLNIYHIAPLTFDNYPSLAQLYNLLKHSNTIKQEAILLCSEIDDFVKSGHAMKELRESLPDAAAVIDLYGGIEAIRSMRNDSYSKQQLRDYCEVIVTKRRNESLLAH